MGFVRANAFMYSDTDLTAGDTYLHRVRATNGGNDSAYSNVISAVTTPLVMDPIKINFQVNGTPPVAGYKIDSGDVFADRGDGLSYGWNFSHTIQDRERAINTDRLLDTLVHFQSGGEWQIEVPNGSYDVKVSLTRNRH